MDESDIETTDNQSPELPAENIPEDSQLPILNGNDFIDATQNAIVDVAENVSEALTLTENQVKPEDNLHFYQDAEFWVGMSFIVVVLLIAKPMWRAIKSVLQTTAENVVGKIKDAIELRDEAQSLLSRYMRQCSDLKQRVAQISEQSKRNIENYQEIELKNLQRDLDKRQRDVQIRINRTTQMAKDEINSSVSRRAVDLAEKTIVKYLSDDDKTRLIDEAIAELDKVKM